MANFGLPYPVLREVNPALIMISMPGAGMTGPWRDHICFGPSLEQAAGMPTLMGYLDGEPMLHGSGLSLADPFGGHNAAVALLMALHWRQVTGRGQYIDLAQNEGLVSVIGDAIMDYTLNKRVQGRRGNRHPFMAPHGCYRCRGVDRWAVIAVSSGQAAG